MTAQTIAEVVQQMDAIVLTARREKSPLGYFAALYRKVTLNVHAGIDAGRFADGARMEKLDVLFANRYLEAWHQYRRGETPRKAWLYAFETATKKRALALQHLLLGMNAHINLDLGIAAAQTCPGKSYPALEQDFNEINKILTSLLQEVQNSVEVVSPTFKFLDELSLRADEVLCNFSIKKARDAAWAHGARMANLHTKYHAAEIARQDEFVTVLGYLVNNPLLHHHTFYQSLVTTESRNVVQVIDSLSS